MSDANSPPGGPPTTPPPGTGGSTSGSTATSSGASTSGSSTPSGSSPSPSGAAPSPPMPESTAAVNQQILGAVQASTDFVFGLKSQLPDTNKDGSRLSAGAAIAYEKAAQAAAIAVQDAADYQRNVMSISTVAQGKALAMMLADQSKAAQAASVLVLAMVASMAATITAGMVGTEQTKMLAAFPRS